MTSETAPGSRALPCLEVYRLFSWEARSEASGGGEGISPVVGEPLVLLLIIEEPITGGGPGEVADPLLGL